MVEDFPEVAGVTFKAVPSFPGYCVGDDGSVWSCWHLGGQRRPSRMVPGRWWQKKPSRVTFGHLTVRFRRDGRDHSFAVHRLVLTLFIGPCPDGMVACHNNGDPSDNRVSNLRWDTHEANMRDMVEHGNSLRGENNPNSKLRANDVRLIVEMFRAGRSRADIASHFGIGWTTVDEIVKGVKWTHVTGLQN